MNKQTLQDKVNVAEVQRKLERDLLKVASRLRESGDAEAADVAFRAHAEVLRVRHALREAYVRIQQVGSIAELALQRANETVNWEGA